MITIDEMHEMLDEIAAELPEEVFERLNGGVSLLPDVVPSGAGAGLYTLGQYRHDQMGRYVVIYYGSIMQVYPGDTREQLREQLKRVLTHELTHHLEALAGERDLELEDEREIEEYKRKLR